MMSVRWRSWNDGRPCSIATISSSTTADLQRSSASAAEAHRCPVSYLAAPGWRASIRRDLGDYPGRIKRFGKFLSARSICGRKFSL
jgi:hypothetical protein